MRLPLALLEVFTAIAERGSLRAAAEELGVKPSTVSHQLKQLENRLGAALFVRTTRSVNLTEAGRALLRGTAPSFRQLGDAMESARATGHAARGSLKLALPEFAYHLVVAKVLPAFRRTYPEIEVELSLTDALEDILEAGLHAGIRQGDLVAQDMIALRLTPPLRLSVLGAPSYFEKHGFPNRPEDLLNHECIRYRFHSSGKLAPWICKGQNGESEISVTGSLIVNALPVAVDAASRGEGLINVLHDYVASEIEAQKLVPVLEAHMPEIPGFFLYFPREYRAMVPLRLFIEQLQSATG
ncbi:LysR family transcriptional regulator [Roseibium sp. HPY-6]|uniref:LysR family transcriptional regulator n=1 Tax=Roseibium sp. HPY-6 TaxID=3229852 RepID=UPI00338FA834